MGPHIPSTRSPLAALILALATALFGCATYYDDYDDHYYGRRGGYGHYGGYGPSAYGRPNRVYVPVYRDDHDHHHRRGHRGHGHGHRDRDHDRDHDDHDDDHDDGDRRRADGPAHEQREHRDIRRDPLGKYGPRR